MIEGLPGQPLLLELQLIDEVAGKYPQVEIRNASGTLVTTLNMIDRGGGLYQVEWAVPALGHYTASFFTYDGSYGGTRTDHEVGQEHLRIYSAENPTITDPPTSGTMTEAILQIAYGDAVVIDTKNGTAGTTYPKGTIWDPVDNLADGLTIAANRGLRKFLLRGNLTLTGTLDDWVVEGIGEEAEIGLAGQDVSDSEFSNVKLSGTMGGRPIRAVNCTLDGIDAFGGTAEWCALTAATITLGETSRFVNCSSAVPGTGTPTIDMDGTGRNLELRAYTGGIQLEGLADANDKVSIDQVAGQVVIAASCTAGTIAVRGVGNLTDASTGATVVETAHLDRPRIADAVWDEDPSEHVADDTFGQSMLRILGHDGENVRDIVLTADAQGRPITAERRIYGSKSDADTDTSPIATFKITATYGAPGWSTLVRTKEP